VRVVNPGLYCVSREFLARAPGHLVAERAGRVLPHRPRGHRRAGGRGARAAVGAAVSLQGVNDRAELATAEDLCAAHRRRPPPRGEHHRVGRGHRPRRRGVEPGAVVGPNVVLRGRTRVGPGPPSTWAACSTTPSSGATPCSSPTRWSRNSEVGPEASIGPFAHLRMDSVVEAQGRTSATSSSSRRPGRRGAKANHLAYLGDGVVGAGPTSARARSSATTTASEARDHHRRGRLHRLQQLPRGPGDHRQERLRGLRLGGDPRRARRRPRRGPRAPGEQRGLRRASASAEEPQA
jgi:bifunctional N-acetylglucosamine-1-phosphate-uridyltransferase/glucosamine-1-phosphate-acetyltransferase GlmU-like protein